MEQAGKHKASLVRLIPQIKSKVSPAYLSDLFLNLADIAEEYEDYPFETDLLLQGIDVTSGDENFNEYALYFQQCIGDIRDHGKRQDWLQGPEGSCIQRTNSGRRTG